jgi:exonuclease VII small subunit
MNSVRKLLILVICLICIGAGFFAGNFYQDKYSHAKREQMLAVMASRLEEVNKIYADLENQKVSLTQSRIQYNRDMLLLIDCSGLIDNIQLSASEITRLRDAVNVSWKILKSGGVDKSSIGGCTNATQRLIAD